MCRAIRNLAHLLQEYRVTLKYNVVVPKYTVLETLNFETHVFEIDVQN